MGGGGAMRAMAKVGIGAANCGIRPAMKEQFPKASRVSAIPASASGEEVKGNLNLKVEGKAAVRGWDDWEFAGGEEEEEKVRVVFGGPPSFGEAREATSELKEALEKTYLSAPSSPIYGYSDMSENKACLTSERTLAAAPSQHAIQAFRFLSESASAQNVVASIASDPNVWNAVLQNPVLQEFLQSQQSYAAFTGVDAGAKGSVPDDFFFQPSPEGSEDGEEAKAGGLAEFLDILKVRVADIWSSLSDYFQTFFMGPAAVFPNADGSARIGFTDKALGGSLLGLASMAILVVVLKRN